MDWLNSINELVQKYSGQGGGTASAPQDPHADFDRAAGAAPPEAVSSGLSEAFRSDRTPPFPEMVSQLFAHSDPNQRAGLLNRLLGSLGSGASGLLPGVGGSQVTPQQASQVQPEQVREVAAHAERRDPSVVDQVSGFYAQHPQVVKALGGLALTIALQHMMRRR